jgi:hypothetical protein
LQFCYDWTFRYEGEELPLNGERKRNDEAHEHHHLKDEEEENLQRKKSISQSCLEDDPLRM